jgi:Sugar (and other) transporter
MQSVGFIIDFILFVIPAATFNHLQHPGAPIKGFQFMYFFSSFWNQFGPNATTFLLAAEVYPAPIRSTAHGISAACGKLGALIPAIIYNYVGNHTRFWIVSWFGLVGFALTVLFIPDTTGLDLAEQERYWACVRAGREEDYHGIAIHPRHLSYYERFVLHRDRFYDPELDRKAKINELRAKYEASIASEKLDDEYVGSESSVSESATKYFELERRSRSSVEVYKEKKEITESASSGSQTDTRVGS